MLRWLTFFLLTFYVFPVQTYAQPNKTQKATEGDKPATPAPPPIVPKQDDSPDLKAKPKAHIDADVRVISSPGKDGYDRALFWANIILAGVGIFGIIVAALTLIRIHRQTREMGLQRQLTHNTLNAIRRQGDLMERQTDIQEAAMRQWVDVEARGAKAMRPISVEGKDIYEVRLEFMAINNTPYVLTVENIRTSIGIEADTWEIFTVETSVDLSPRKESDSNAYSFYVPAQTIKKERFEKGTVVTVNGQITFRDCLGKVRTDYFGGLYRCGQEGFVKINQLGIVPDRKKVYARNPNEPS
jgi:hypothetical protein